MEKTTVVVIGGGVIGLSTAYQLKQEGVSRLVLIEQGTVGDGATLFRHFGKTVLLNNAATNRVKRSTRRGELWK